MTPKEKCDSLHTDYLKVLGVQRLDYPKKILYNIAKQCVLINVEEIIDVLGKEGVYSFADSKVTEFYESVKKEAENL